MTRVKFSWLAVVVTAIGIVSLCLGFGRELFIVWQYGIGRVTDAYFIAAFTPQIVYQLIIAGPLLAGLVPELNTVAVEKGVSAMDAMAAAVLGWSIVVLATSVGLLMIVAPEVARLSAPGYDAERLHLTSQLLTILAPQIFSFGTGSVLIAVLYARGRVLSAALAQLVNNSLVLLFIAVLYPPFGIQGIAIGVTLASVGYLCWLLVAVHLSGQIIIPRLESIRNNRRFVFSTLLPLVGISLLSQLSGFWERLFASLLPVGQLSGISYGYRILFVAQAASAAVGTVTLASLSGSVARRESVLFHRQTGWAIEINLVLSIAAAAVLMTGSQTVVHALYGSSSLSAPSALLVAEVVRIAAIALPAISLQVVFAQTLYARRQIRALAVLAVLQLAIQLPLSPWLIFALGYRGFAIANVTAQVLVAIGFYLYLVRGRLAPDPKWLLIILARAVAAAALGASFVAWIWPDGLASQADTFWAAILSLGVRSTASIAAISVLLVILGDPLTRLPILLVTARLTRPSRR